LLGPTGMYSYNTRPVKKGELLELFSTASGRAARRWFQARYSAAQRRPSIR
jgi:hypothetical protein